MNFSSFLIFLLLFKFALAVERNQNTSVKEADEIHEDESRKQNDPDNPSIDTQKIESEEEELLDLEIEYPSESSDENSGTDEGNEGGQPDSEIKPVNEDQSSGQGVDENDVKIRNQYIARMDLDPQDISSQKKLPFVIQASKKQHQDLKTPQNEKDDICLTAATRIDFEKFYVPDALKIFSFLEKNPHLTPNETTLEYLMSNYNDFVFVGWRKEKISLTPICPMKSSEQSLLLEKYKSVKSFEVVTMNILVTVAVKKTLKSAFWPSTQPCEEELQLSWIKIPRPALGYTLYDAGYVVKFKKPEQHCGAQTASLMDDTLFFHLALFGLNEETKETIFSHHFIPFYNIQREIEPTKRIDPDESINKHIYPAGTNFKRIYDDETNQKRIFMKLFPENFQKYFNPSTSLVLVRQELIDQRTLPLMSYKQVALSYMNIVPMYKVIRNETWSKVEKAVSSIPWIDGVTILAGTYGELKIENTIIRLDDGTETEPPKKIVTVPYAFYKLVIAHAIQKETGYFRNFGIIIITHNNPFETEFKKICEDKDLLACEKFSSINVGQINPKLGLTYCCKYSKKMAESLKIDPSSISVSGDFDIDELRKYVGEEVVRSSSTPRMSNINRTEKKEGRIKQIFTGLTHTIVTSFKKDLEEPPSNREIELVKRNALSLKKDKSPPKQRSG